MEKEIRENWQKLISICFTTDVKKRFSFVEILGFLDTF